MRTYDMTPLFRSTVGFDRMFSDLLDGVGKAEANSYPPYNIEIVDENSYRITLAVAGFAEDELDIEVTDRVLRVAGSQESKGEDRNFLHRGIAGRSFERRFQLADHVKVEGAALTNGLLNVELRREIPEEHKPRRIVIGASDKASENHKVIEGGKAA